MNRTVFSLPDRGEFRTASGLAITRLSEPFSGDARRLDDLIDLLDRRRGVVLSSGTTVPGRYESFDLGFADPPLVLETSGTEFSLSALNPRGEVLIDAWMRYNLGNVAALAILGGTWLAGRLFISGWQSGKGTRNLVIAKDVLVGGAVATGVACAAIGYSLDKQETRDQRLVKAVSGIGWAHMAFIAGVGVITTALAMKSGKSTTWSFFSKFLP